MFVCACVHTIIVVLLINIDKILEDKEKFKKFKEFVRNNHVTTNVGAQQLLILCADSMDAEGAEQTKYLVKNIFHENVAPARGVPRTNSYSNHYRAEKDDKAGFKWIASSMEQIIPMRRRASAQA